MKELFETHQQGLLTIENKDLIIDRAEDFAETISTDFGIQIAKDGRIWICINGIAFLRFKPIKKSKGDKS